MSVLENVPSCLCGSMMTCLPPRIPPRPPEKQKSYKVMIGQYKIAQFYLANEKK